MGAPRRKRKERPLWGSTGRKSFLPENELRKELKEPVPRPNQIRIWDNIARTAGAIILALALAGILSQSPCGPARLLVLGWSMHRLLK